MRTCRVSAAQDVEHFKVTLARRRALRIAGYRTIWLNTLLRFSPWAMPFIPCPHVVGQSSLGVPFQRSRRPS